MRLGPFDLRATVGAVGAGMLCCGFVGGSWLGSAGAAEQPAAAATVVLNGSGAAEIAGELTGWQDDLTGVDPDQPVVEVQYIQTGSTAGRGQLIAGRRDFAVSGSPFTASELAQRPPGAGELISAPISVASLSVVLTTPDGVGFQTQVAKPVTECDPDDPANPDPDSCVTIGEYTGPIRIPAESLAAMMLRLPPSAEDNQLALWGGPAMVTALGTDTLSIQHSQNRDTFVVRAEGSAANLYLQTYAATLAPQAWALAQRVHPELTFDPPREQFPPGLVIGRSGSDTQIGLIANAKNDAATGNITVNWAGNMGAIPTTMLPRVLASYPAASLRIAEIQNGHGDWVTADRASIEAALAAGDSPIVGATHDVAGAYPLVWINRVYVVAGSLSPEKANSMAAMIRYIATDGQQAAVDHGGAPLTVALRNEALSAANRIVEANCSVDGYELTTGGPGEREPTTPQVQALRGLRHCEALPPPESTTTTTTTVAASSSTVSSDAPVSSVTTTIAAEPPSDEGSNVPRQPPPSRGRSSTTTTTTEPVISTTSTPATPTPTTSTTVVATGGQGTRPRGRALAALPLDLPDDGRGYQKTGTLFLGAGGFLLLRSALGRRRAR